MTIIFITLLTFGLYRFSRMLARRFPILLFHPLIFTPALIIIVIQLLPISVNTYTAGSVVLTHMLAPATIAFAIPMYKHIAFLRQYFVQIICGVLVGSIVAILSSFGLALLFNVDEHLLISLLPRSITTPLAIEVSTEIGGVPALTIVFVIITGILGSLVGPLVFNLLNIQSAMAKGLALGMAAHAVGTNRALEYGEEAVTFSTLAMIFAGVITIILGLTVLPLIIFLL
ncbi:TIGR00659 family protein [Amphibacillus marinus]|uniref:TIGR00659 family protein n=1 Tax=Amphibacillus marinus TaxID=872970 RepID=A0A1H8QTJ0_9BACI|nr:LrgB family protein [Amphibacillus marinus]SEO57485.1 TIGR00659 family protein [Amphibacillus marinus]